MPVPPQALGSSECHHQLGTLGEGLRVLGTPVEQQRQVWTLPALSLGQKKEDGAPLSPAALAGLSDSQGGAARPGVPCISEGTAAGTRWEWGGQARPIASGQVAARSSLDMCHGTGTMGLSGVTQHSSQAMRCAKVKATASRHCLMCTGLGYPPAVPLLPAVT